MVPTLAIPLSTAAPTSLALTSSNITLALSDGEAGKAQRNVPEHNAFLNITYFPSDRLPVPVYRDVLRTAWIQTVEYYSDTQIVAVPYSYHKEDCYFSARSTSTPGATEEKLTYGILEESIRVLRQFLFALPYTLTVNILEGMMETGPLIGLITIDNAGPPYLAGS